MATLALVGLSVRALAQAARAEGHTVLALDVFGDADTQRLAQHWWPLAPPAGLGSQDVQVNGEALLAGLQAAAEAGAQAWIAAAGLEHQPALQAAAERLLPHLGTRADDQARVRDPACWLPLLDRAGVARPVTAPQVPADAVALAPGEPPRAGAWLIKCPVASGGLRQRWGRPGERPDPAVEIAQRWLPGQAMSATFVADGHVARLLGFNRLHSRVLGGQPFVFAGACGPLPVPGPVRVTAEAALAALVPALGVRGLGSLDLVVHGAHATVLELNARPPATLALYPGRRPVDLHLRACGAAALAAAPPPLQPQHPPQPPSQPGRPGAPGGAPALAPLRGFEIVYSPRAGAVSPHLAQALAALDGVCDLPHAGTPVAEGAPLCSLSAEAPDAAGLARHLDSARQRVHHLLEAAWP